MEAITDRARKLGKEVLSLDDELHVFMEVHACNVQPLRLCFVYVGQFAGGLVLSHDGVDIAFVLEGLVGEFGHGREGMLDDQVIRIVRVEAVQFARFGAFAVHAHFD
ncbi:hypothetical protein D3C71_1791150 [compost metagenome]